MIPRYCPECGRAIRLSDSLRRDGVAYAFQYNCDARGGCSAQFTYLPETPLDPPMLLKVMHDEKDFAKRMPPDGKPAGRVLIVAGTKNQAQEKARELGLGKDGWVYPTDDRSLRGWLPVRIVYCGTWYQRADRDQLRDELKVVESRMAHAQAKK